jgi:DNA-binding MarR family transcriptional regulator
MEDAGKVINSVLVKLVNEVWVQEGKAIITGEFQDITNNDMHIIEAIDLGEGKNMSVIAKKLNVTVGTLTTAVNNLVKKNYVERRRSDEDRRVVYVKLTEKGIKAYKHHEEYHRQMTQAILDKLEEGEVPVLVKALEALKGFFAEFSQNHVAAQEDERK